MADILNTHKLPIDKSSRTTSEIVTEHDLDSAITAIGLTIPQAAQADSTAVDVAGIVSDFNALLAKLRSAGIITA